MTKKPNMNQEHLLKIHLLEVLILENFGFMQLLVEKVLQIQQ